MVIMKRYLIAVVILCCFSPPAPAANWVLIRRITQGIACASAVADIVSTNHAIASGAVETNPLLVNHGRIIYPKFISLKISSCAFPILFSELTHRFAPSTRTEQLITGAGIASIAYTGVAVANNITVSGR